MPHLDYLKVQGFRNISVAEIEPGPFLNIIVGPNGAGKTSLLEAISVLAHGRSFRTRTFRNLIKEHHNDLTVFGRIESEEGAVLPVGIQRRRNGEFRIRIDEQTVHSTARLASALPLVLINSNSFRLIDGGPVERRKFFDWLVFHVKREFADLYSQYSRCTKQRNTLLRRDKITYAELLPWDKEIAHLSFEIETTRQQCFELFCDAFRELVSSVKVETSEERFYRAITFEYVNGWKAAKPDFLKQLKDQFQKDISYGYTTLGPHKADIKIRHGKTAASEILSRGQQKLLISALYISEATVFKHITGKNPVFAIDDLPSEIDSISQQRLGNWLKALDTQVFVTGITDEFVSGFWPDCTKNKHHVFHVKHGYIDS